MRFYVIQNKFFNNDEVAVKATDSTSFFSISLAQTFNLCSLTFILNKMSFRIDS